MRAPREGSDGGFADFFVGRPSFRHARRENCDIRPLVRRPKLSSVLLIAFAILVGALSAEVRAIMRGPLSETFTHPVSEFPEAFRPRPGVDVHGQFRRGMAEQTLGFFNVCP